MEFLLFFCERLCTVTFGICNVAPYNTSNLGLENATASVEELAMMVNNRLSIVNYTLTAETQEIKDGLELVEDSIIVLGEALSDTMGRLTVMEGTISEIENRIDEIEVDGKSNNYILGCFLGLLYSVTFYFAWIWHQRASAKIVKFILFYED